MGTVIFFDIDSTLLNSAKIHAFTAVHLLRKFNKADLQGLWYLLSGHPKNFLSSPTAKNSFLAPQYYRNALFEDVLPTLEKLKGKVSLGIFSQGPSRFQRAKLHLSGIEKYFSPELIFILPPRKTNKANQVLAQLPNLNIYFVDDRPEIAETLANHRAKVFLIRRDPQPIFKNGRIIERVIKIESLKEVLNFI